MPQITLTVNGKSHTLDSPPERPLLDVLREDLHLTGAKFGCGEGRCGACSVLVDDKRIFSCRTDVGDMEGKKITTIEGLADGEKLHPVQEAFLAEGAYQCGYCIPGHIVAAVALLKRNPNPTEEEIISGMNGNVCRCNGYPKLVNAVKTACGQKPTYQSA